MYELINFTDLINLLVSKTHCILNDWHFDSNKKYMHKTFLDNLGLAIVVLSYHIHSHPVINNVRNIKKMPFTNNLF